MADETGKSTRQSYGHVARTVIGLLVACFIVGAVLTFIGVDPVDFWRGIGRRIGDAFSAIFSLGWGAFATVGSFILIGAIIVLPIWVVIRLLNWRKR